MFMDLKVLRKEYKLPLCILQNAVKLSQHAAMTFSGDNQINKKVDLKQLLENCACDYVQKLPRLPLKTVVYGIASAKKQIAIVKLLCSSERCMSCIVDIANTLAQEALVNGKDNVLNRNINLLAASLGERFQIEAADIFSLEDCICGLYCHKNRLVGIAQISAADIPEAKRPLVNHVAENLAKHAVYYYGAYLSREKHISINNGGLIETLFYKTESPDFSDFILPLPYVISDGIVSARPRHFFHRGWSYPTLAEYLTESSRILQQKIPQGQNIQLKPERFIVLGDF